MRFWISEPLMVVEFSMCLGLYDLVEYFKLGTTFTNIVRRDAPDVTLNRINSVIMSYKSSQISHFDSKFGMA